MFNARLGFERKFPPIDEIALGEFEESLPEGCLPRSYRLFLEQWNGGAFIGSQYVGATYRGGDPDFDFICVSLLL